eukprot:754661-Pyramimonas_sp.AAC.1
MLGSRRPRQGQRGSASSESARWHGQPSDQRDKWATKEVTSLRNSVNTWNLSSSNAIFTHLLPQAVQHRPGYDQAGDGQLQRLPIDVVILSVPLNHCVLLGARFSAEDRAQHATLVAFARAKPAEAPQTLLIVSPILDLAESIGECVVGDVQDTANSK